MNTDRHRYCKTMIASKILDDYPDIIGFDDPVDTIKKIIFIMEITGCYSIESFYNNVIKYLEDRNTRDVYNKPKTENDNTYVQVDFYFFEYYKYLKTFEKLIKNKIFPLYPKDVYDITYFWARIKEDPEEYIKVNENGNIEIPILKII